MSLANAMPKATVLRPYLIYVISFVGAGMVSGGVVHYPLNENFYGALTIFGGVVFALGSLANEVLSGKGFPKLLPLLSLILTSLMLSFGIGMLSGGIQHFIDFPKRAAILIPTGISVSFLAFCLKAKLFNRASAKKVAIASMIVLITAGSSLFTLTKLAQGMTVEEHSHSTTATENTLPEDDHSKHPHNK